MKDHPHAGGRPAPVSAPAVHDRALALVLDHLTRNGAPRPLAELVAAHLEPIMVDVSRDREALPVVLLDVRGRELTLHRFATRSASERFAQLNEERGRWFAGVNLGQLLELAANQLRERAHANNE